MPHRSHHSVHTILFSLLAVSLSHAAFDLSGGSVATGGSDGDLTDFVTRPDIKAPLYKVLHKADAGITPGYWFVAPYADIKQQEHPEYYYQPCSTGPHIYDGNGELVWSGACKSRNQNACDFRLHVDADGNERLSTLFVGYEQDYKSAAIVMDSSFNHIHNFDSPQEESRLNMHEFNVIDNGRSALYLSGKATLVDISELGLHNRTTGWVSYPGFREIEIPSGRVVFEWWARGKVSLLESTINPNFEELAAVTARGWNWFHANSVDKDDNGDYLLSGRFADTVYKISGKTGDILWRLGGQQSSFRLDGFNFSKQHDARFVSRDDSIEVISLFDNAKALHPGVEVPQTSNVSSALVVQINHDTKSAKVLQRISRPDGALTKLRGNYQRLNNGNGNDFVSWAGNGYISEHTAEGELLLEAQFASKRFVTYRAYKHNFTAYPEEPPVLMTKIYGEGPHTSTTVWYVSWNGATEVATWQFHRASNSSISGQESLVGVAKKAGFETTFVSDGFEREVFAVAVADNGTVLGRTDVQRVTLPSHWNESSYQPSFSLGLPSVMGRVGAKDEL